MFSLVPRKKERGLRPRGFFAPFFDMDDFGEKMMQEFYGGESEKMTLPAFNVYKEEGNTVVEASLPGYDKKDISIELDKDLLTVKGEHKEEAEKKEKDYYHREFRSGSFIRSVRVPGKFNADELKAQHKDGILKITIPTIDEEQNTVKKIDIE